MEQKRRYLNPQLELLPIAPHDVIRTSPEEEEVVTLPKVEF